MKLKTYGQAGLVDPGAANTALVSTLKHTIFTLTADEGTNTPLAPASHDGN